MGYFIEVESKYQKVSIRKDAIVAVINQGHEVRVILAGAEFEVDVKQPYEKFMTWLNKQLEQ